VYTCTTKDAAFVHGDHVEAATDMLHAYRKHCAANSSPGQLILPESLKLLPVYLSAMEKLAAFTPNPPANKAAGSGGAKPTARPGAAAGSAGGAGGPRPGGGASGAGAFADVLVRADERAAALVALNGLPPARLVPLFYPRLYALHTMAAAHGVPLEPDEDASNVGSGADGLPHKRPVANPLGLPFEALMRVVTPPTTFPSIEQVAPHGVYLLEHAQGLLLHVGIDADEELLGGLFGPGTAAATQLEPGTPLPLLPGSDLSLRTWTVIAAIRARRPPYLPLSVIVPMDAPGRERFGSLLAEDRVGPARSYVDLLCSMHAAIQTRLNTGA
jgi:protein transport protein SEC24